MSDYYTNRWSEEYDYDYDFYDHEDELDFAFGFEDWLDFAVRINWILLVVLRIFALGFEDGLDFAVGFLRI